MSLRVFGGLEDLPPDFGPCVLTIGNFDGVHAAHQAIMRRVAALGREHGWTAAVLTFDPHPARLLNPEQAPRLLTSIDQRTALMTCLEALPPDSRKLIAQRYNGVDASRLARQFNRTVQELSTKVENSSDAIKAEARPKIVALRVQAEQLKLQLDAAQNATETSWTGAKAEAQKIYVAMKDGFAQARQWLAEKIAP